MSDEIGSHLRKTYGHYREFNPDYEFIATVCERKLGVDFEVEMDENYYPDRCDPGWDCVLPGVGETDCKGSPTPGHLLVEKGRVKAAAYVLAHWVKDPPPYGTCLAFLGWAWAEEVLAVEPVFWPRLWNHKIPVRNLRPMSELRAIVDKARGIPVLKTQLNLF